MIWLLLATLLPRASHADCIAARGKVCGSDDICVSDRRPEGVNDRNDCLPDTVCKVLRNMAEAFKANGKIEVLSADRSADCVVRGGAGCNSAHAWCRAADVYVKNIWDEQFQYDEKTDTSVFSTERRAAQKGRMLPFLQDQQNKGFPIRYNIYCTGVVHVDDMPDPGKPDPGAKGGPRPDSYESCVEEQGPKVWPRPFPRPAPAAEAPTP